MTIKHFRCECGSTGHYMDVHGKLTCGKRGCNVVSINKTKHPEKPSYEELERENKRLRALLKNLI